MTSAHHPPSGGAPSPLASFAVIAAAVGGLAAAFAYVGGWLSPQRIAPHTLVDVLEKNGGVFAGYRRAHAKGLCVAGHFESNGQGQALSRAAVFAPGASVPVTGRFNVGTRNPLGTDGAPQFHSLALRFTLANGQEWRTAMDHTPIFPVATPDAFVGLQQATTADPATGKPDGAKVAAFLEKHPETKAFLTYMGTQPLPDSFISSPYYSINAFRFLAADGHENLVRWTFEPEVPMHPLDKETMGALGRDFLFQDLVTRLSEGPARWHLILTVAQPGDPADAITVWPQDRRQVDVGTLVLDSWQAEAPGNCRDFNFDPTILPDGIQPSSDPILAARSAAYSVSFRRRAGESTPANALADLKPTPTLPAAGAAQ